LAIRQVGYESTFVMHAFFRWTTMYAFSKCVYVEQLLTFSFRVSSGFKLAVSIWYLWWSCPDVRTGVYKWWKWWCKWSHSSSLKVWTASWNYWLVHYSV